MEKETFEKILAKKAKDNNVIDLNAYAIGIIDGYKCQQENMYSDEEVLMIVNQFRIWSLSYIEKNELIDWFEKFKKK
jgi:hypothetical protein